MTLESQAKNQAIDWPIWVISLPDATARRNEIAAQLAALDLQFSFIDAVDGRRGLSATHEALVDRPGTLARHGYGMSDGEYACALSHQEAYLRIVDEGLPGAVILEDDAILTTRFRDFYLARGYEHYPIVQMFYFNGSVWKSSAKQIGDVRIERLASSAWSTVSYSVSSKAARKLRAASLPLRGRADWPCETFRLIGHAITNPRLVMHPLATDQQTTITRTNLIPEGFDYSAGYAKGWRRLLSLESWARLIRRPFIREVTVEFAPSPNERASLLTGAGMPTL